MYSEGMDTLQCVHCRADIDLATGKCGGECKCDHIYEGDDVNTSSFTCKICGMTVMMDFWRANNFRKYLQQTVIKYHNM